MWLGVPWNHHFHNVWISTGIYFSSPNHIHSNIRFSEWSKTQSLALLCSQYFSLLLFFELWNRFFVKKSRNEPYQFNTKKSPGIFHPMLGNRRFHKKIAYFGASQHFSKSTIWITRLFFQWVKKTSVRSNMMVELMSGFWTPAGDSWSGSILPSRRVTRRAIVYR